MKRILYLSLVLMMAVSLMACGKQEAMPQIPAAEEAPLLGRAIRRRIWTGGCDPELFRGYAGIW